jgi:hypothetical protein
MKSTTLFTANKNAPRTEYLDTKSEEKTREILPIKASLALLIISSLALPASNFFGVPVKHIAYILFLFALLILWMRGAKIDGKLIILLAVSSIFFVFYVLVGALNSFSNFRYVFNDGLTFFITIIVALSILMARSMRVVEDEEIASYVFYGVYIFSLWKSILGLLMLLGLASFPQVSDFCARYMDYKPVGGWGYAQLQRINFIIFDFISVCFLFYLACFPTVFSKVPVFLRKSFVIIGIACLVFAFSRLLFALAALFLAYIYLFKYSLRKRFVFASALILALVAIFGFSQEAVVWTQEAFETRYQSRAVDVSDEIRKEQTAALMDAWHESPVIGGGFGYYTKDYIRSERAPYIYEVQWLSFLIKLGLLGMIFPIFLVLLLLYGILNGQRIPDHYVLALVLLSFLAGGFTNQYLVNSASGVFYAAQIIFASILRRNMSRALT